MFKYILVAIVLSSSPAFAVNHCKQYEKNAFLTQLLQSLSARLSYTHEEFCNSERIMDIFREERLVYHQEDDQYHPYEFITLHYNEYSCEYQYNIDGQKWASQYCYNTW